MGLVLICVGLGAWACEQQVRRDQDPGLSSRGEPLLAASAVPSAASLRSASREGPSAAPPIDRPQALLPLAAPDMPRQLVACGQREFWRLLEGGMEAYEVTTARPRGARRLLRRDVDRPSNIIALGGHSSLIISASGVLRHYRAETALGSYPRIPLFGPLQAYPDARNINGFWVRYLRDDELHYFSLPENATSQRVLVGEVRPLPGFDRRVLTLLGDGTPLYSTKRGLVRASDERRADYPTSMGPAVGLWSASTTRRYWLADASGHLQLFEQSRGEPLLQQFDLQGVPWDVEHRAGVVAALSARRSGPRTELSVLVSTPRHGTRTWSVPGEAAHPDPQHYDLCVMGDVPWVVVGGPEQLLLYDFARDELINHWGP